MHSFCSLLFLGVFVMKASYIEASKPYVRNIAPFHLLLLFEVPHWNGIFLILGYLCLCVCVCQTLNLNALLHLALVCSGIRIS